jgi:hypothetical protein
LRSDFRILVYSRLTLKFNLFSLYGERPQWRNEGNSDDADPKLLENSRLALINIESHPLLVASNGVNLDLGAGLPADANPWLLAQLDSASTERLFWLGLHGKGPLALYLVLADAIINEPADRLAATILAAVNSPYWDFSPEARAAADELLHLRPLLAAGLLSPISIELNPKILSALREISQHLAAAKLGNK